MDRSNYRSAIGDATRRLRSHHRDRAYYKPVADVVAAVAGIVVVDFGNRLPPKMDCANNRRRRRPFDSAPSLNQLEARLRSLIVPSNRMPSLDLTSRPPSFGADASLNFGPGGRPTISCADCWSLGEVVAVVGDGLKAFVVVVEFVVVGIGAFVVGFGVVESVVAGVGQVVAAGVAPFAAAGVAAFVVAFAGCDVAVVVVPAAEAAAVVVVAGLGSPANRRTLDSELERSDNVVVVGLDNPANRRTLELDLRRCDNVVVIGQHFNIAPSSNTNLLRPRFVPVLRLKNIAPKLLNFALK